MEEVVWKEEFRRLTMEGITSRSRFIQVGQGFSYYSFGPEIMFPCKKGFYIFWGSDYSPVSVDVLKTDGSQVNVHEAVEGINPRRLCVYHDPSGDVLCRDRKITRTFNVDSGEFVAPHQITAEVKIPISIDFSFSPQLDRGNTVAVSNYGFVSRYRSPQTNPKFVFWNQPDEETEVYHVVDTVTGETEVIKTTGEDFGYLIHGISNLHYYRDVLYNVNLWYEDDILGRLESLGIVSDGMQALSDGIFSGMHCILQNDEGSLIFFYNLESKEFTFLNVSTLKVYPMKEYIEKCESLGKVTEEFDSQHTAMIYFSTVEGMLYILIDDGNNVTMITHR